VDLAQGQFLFEKQTLNRAKSLIYRAGIRRQSPEQMDEFDDDGNSIQFFIIYVPSQQLQGQ
jgi:hypothetical protein